MFVILLAVGIVAGVLAGLFGVGGGVLFAPLFYLIFSGQGIANPVSWTIGTSLFCTFIASISSSFQQFRQHNHYLGQGLKVGVLGAIGVFAGKWVVESPHYTEMVFVGFLTTLMLFVAVVFYRRGTGKTVIEENPGKIGWNKSGFTGGLGGFVAALAGIGGGAVMVPIMNLWYRIGLSRAVSISSLAIVIISLSGWLQFAFLSHGSGAVTGFTLGTVDFGAAFPVMIGAFAGGMSGARLNHLLPEKTVQIGFSVLVVLIAGTLVYGLY